MTDVDASPEVVEMQEKERKRWLTVAAAQNTRKAWDSARKAVDEMAEKFDAEPEGESAAMVFILLAALSVDSFSKTARESIEQLTELQPPKDDAP